MKKTTHKLTAKTVFVFKKPATKQPAFSTDPSVTLVTILVTT
ncbi:hypothetical protein [Pedobacter aquatilis]|nr:hypothetical protein [Pedobacter aquatilis]